jgi:hypothetical protein
VLLIIPEKVTSLATVKLRVAAPSALLSLDSSALLRWAGAAYEQGALSVLHYFNNPKAALMTLPGTVGFMMKNAL